MFRQIQAPVSTPCPPKSRGFRTISRKSNLVSASSTSSSLTFRTPFRVSTPKFPAPLLLPPPLALQLPPLPSESRNPLPQPLHRHQVPFPPARPRRTLSTPTDFAISPAASMTSPA